MKISQYCLLGLSFILFLTFLCYGQEKLRTIEKRVTKNEPLELVSAEVEEKSFDKENKVLADRNWLKGLRLNVKNISNKRIVYLRVSVQVPRQGKMQYPLLLSLRFGQIPPPEFTNSDISKLKGLKPNESVQVSIDPNNLEHFMTKFMPENEVEDIEQVKFFFDFIVFDDGTAWSMGSSMRRDADNPNRWNVIRTSPN
jgi:hypothetical protein